MRTIFFKFLLASFLLVVMPPALLMAQNPVVQGPVSILSADSFHLPEGSTDSLLINGWFWLRNPTYNEYVEWDFSGLPAAATVGSLHLRLDCLVTNTTSGGSGYSTYVEVCIPGDIDKCYELFLKNAHEEFQESSDTKGWGYDASGTVALPKNLGELDSGLKIRLSRIDPNTEHVGVNQGCCTIEWR